MRFLEVRRHTMRAKPGQHLSQAGVTLARRVGSGIGPFNRVITSTVPRAFETAIAMGFAVDEQLEPLSTMGKAVESEIAWPASFARIAQTISQSSAVATYARAQAELWHAIAAALPDVGRALIVTRSVRRRAAAR